MHLVVLATLVLAVSGQSPFSIKPDNARETVANSDLLMSCLYPSYFKSVRWLGIDKEAITNVTVGVKLDSSLGALFLTLLNVTSDMNGMYTCEGYDTMINQTVSETRIVSVFEPIRFVAPKMRQTFELGKTVDVVCQVSGNPAPTVVWKKGTKNLIGTQDNSRVYKDPFTNNLIIRNITKWDEGQYSCLARELNKGQTKDLSIFVDVQFGPAGIQVLKLVVGIARGQVVLTCNATGKPEPVYKWYKGNMGMLTNETIITEGVSSDGKTLIISNVTASDAGKYTCIAKNDYGTDSDTTNVIINVPPSITEYTGDSVVEGSNALITCRASGIPTPSITVYRHGVAINSSQLSDTTPMVVEYNGNEARVTFTPALYADSGDYTCVATNDAGSEEAVMKLDIMYAPRETTLPEVYSCLNEKAELSCIFDANPKPTLEWGQMGPKELPTLEDDLFVFTNDSVGIVMPEMTFTPVVTNENIQVQDQGGVLKLKINQVTEETYGKYYCRARNDHGESVAEGELMIAMTATAPINIQVTDRSTSQANIIFSPPTNIVSQIYRYLIFLSSGGLPVHEDEIIAGGDGNIEGRVLAYTFSNLDHNTEYEFKVAAENCKGVGDYSEPVAFTTQTIVKPDVVNVESIPLGSNSDSYSLKWSALGTGGGNINSMEITYKPVIDLIGSNVNASAPQPITVQLSPNDKEFVDKQYTITGLNESTEYEVSITVTNEVGSKTTLFVFTTRAAQMTTSPLATLDLAQGRHQVVISGKALKKNFTQTKLVAEPNILVSPTVPSTTTSEGGKKLATGSTNLLLIAIIVAAILLVLIIIDIACCIARHCGVAYLIWSSTCGRSSKDEMNVKDADVEEGSTEQSKKDNKADDIAEVGNEKLPLDVAPLANGNPSQPDEETPLQVAASKPEVAGNGDSGNDVKASLMQNEQPTPANTPLDGAAEVNEAVKPEDVAIAVDNKASNVEQA